MPVTERFRLYSEKGQAYKEQLFQKNLPTFRPQLSQKTNAISPSRSPMQKATLKHQKSKSSYNGVSTCDTDRNEIFTKESEIKQTTVIQAKPFLDLSPLRERIPNLFDDGSMTMRSVTPEKPKPLKVGAAKVQEIEYSPTMEFLVEKVSAQKGKKVGKP